MKISLLMLVLLLSACADQQPESVVGSSSFEGSIPIDGRLVFH